MLRALVVASLTLAVVAAAAYGAPAPDRLDRELRHRAEAPRGHSRVILHLAPGANADSAIAALHGTLGRRLALLNDQVADVPDSALASLATTPGVDSISLDRSVEGTLERTGGTIGSTWVAKTLGFDGSGIGIAVVDSGVTAFHDDLAPGRVARFVDFVNFQADAYDDYGHGTHVAGILAGDGHDSEGRRRGIAPGSSLLVEKVLDAGGKGYISNVVAAIDYAIANRDVLHIRIINLSVAAHVTESYATDPLTLAAKRAVDAGIVVVSAAGNNGRRPDGSVQFESIGAPGNAPWVLTVGASSHNGTIDRSDDTVAPFSSRGPGAVDFQAKPDLVAPGVGIESLADPNSTLFIEKPAMRLWGTVPTPAEPYLSLTGTSMSAPVVSGTIALMLQANPALTPNLVKAILEFTAEEKVQYNSLTEGGGFLNARGAVQLAQALAAGGSLTASSAGDPTPWSAHVNWGNHRLDAAQLGALAKAWGTDVVWGSAIASGGEPIPLAPNAGDNVVWGAECGGADCDNIVWGTSTGPAQDNVVWSSDTTSPVDDIVWAPPPGVLRGRGDREARQ